MRGRPAKVSFAGIYPGQAVVAVADVLAIGNEYSTWMIKLSLTATPRRLTWLFAKTAVLCAPVLIAPALAVASSALAGRLILPGRGFTPAHGVSVPHHVASRRELYLSPMMQVAPGQRSTCRGILV